MAVIKHIVIAYIIATFLFAIPYTAMRLNRENATAELTTGRVNLLRSYWYESYAMRDIVIWCRDDLGQPVIIGVSDKAAMMIYGREYGLIGGNAGPDMAYILTAYPAYLRKYHAAKLYPQCDNFMSVWEVQP